MKVPWVIDIKGWWGKEHFEISVLRDNYGLGKQSYGWFDERKLLITHSGGPCRWPLTQLIWEKQVNLAYEVAEEMNELEK